MSPGSTFSTAGRLNVKSPEFGKQLVAKFAASLHGDRLQKECLTDAFAVLLEELAFTAGSARLSHLDVIVATHVLLTQLPGLEAVALSMGFC